MSAKEAHAIIRPEVLFAYLDGAVTDHHGYAMRSGVNDIGEVLPSLVIVDVLKVLHVWASSRKLSLAAL